MGLWLLCNLLLTHGVRETWKAPSSHCREDGPGMRWDRNTRLSLALLGPCPHWQMVSGPESHSVTQDKCRSQSLLSPKSSTGKPHTRRESEGNQGRGRAAHSSTPSAGTLMQGYAQSPQSCVPSSQGSSEDRSNGKSLQWVSWQTQEGLQGENRASKSAAAPELLLFSFPQPRQSRPGQQT